MRLVVDANILFSYIKKRSFTRNLIISNPVIEMWIPPFLFEELEKYKDLIIKKAGIDERQYWIIMNDLRDITQQVNVNDIYKKWEDVDRICPDPDDVQYLVAAMELGCAVCSNDKRLKAQELVSVLNTEEVRI